MYTKKKIIYAGYVLALLLTWLPMSMHAQVTIGAGDPPQKFSTLEIVSNKTGGLRLPHLTTAERNAMEATTEFQAQNHRGDAGSSTNPGLGLGLIIYNTDTNCTEYWNGKKWVSMCQDAASIILASPCGDYNPTNIPQENANGVNSGCVYTPKESPDCSVSSGKPFEVYLTAGAVYANLEIDPVTSAFVVNFQPNTSSQSRIAVVRVTSNCSGEYKDFIFTQKGLSCPSGIPAPTLSDATANLCKNGSIFVQVTNAQAATDYVWVYGGIVVHTGNWYEVRRAGIYKVYAGLAGCGTPAVLTVTDNAGSTAPGAALISATNGGILCSTGNVILSVSTTDAVVWYHDGKPHSSTNNPLVLTGASSAGEWFAIVKDASGCTSASSNVLTLIDQTAVGNALKTPVATINDIPFGNNGIVICKGGTIKLEVTNASDYTSSSTMYEWFDNGVSIGTSSDPVFYYTIAADKNNLKLSVTVSDNTASCPASSASQSIDVNFTAPTATTINNGETTAVVCGGTPALLTAAEVSAPLYEWACDGQVIAGQNNYTLTTLKAGNYTVRYKDANGCWSKLSNPIEVLISSPLVMSWTTPPPVQIVKGSQLTVEVGADRDPANYKWTVTSDDTNAISSQNVFGTLNNTLWLQLGTPAADQSNVKIKAEAIGHICGDQSIEATVTLINGCNPGTSIKLLPQGPYTMTEGSKATFTVTTDASNSMMDLQYKWYVDNAEQVGATGSSFLFAPTQVRDYTVAVKVWNSCRDESQAMQASTAISVIKNPDQYVNDNSGDFVIVGKNCFDVAQTSYASGGCGDITTRRTPADFLDGTNSWDPARTFSYTLKSNGTAALPTDITFVVVDNNNNNQGLVNEKGGSGTSINLTFKEDVLTVAKGLDRGNALKIYLYALYEVGGVKKRKIYTISVQDCTCKCGAKTYENTTTNNIIFKEFMCHNLGVDESVNAFEVGKALHGDWYQYGSSIIAAFGPNHPTLADQINPAIGTWNSTHGGAGWEMSDGTKGPTDPCPPGFKVPTRLDWTGVRVNNTVTRTGSWNNNSSNFTTGVTFGDYLFIPVCGYRASGNGSLVGRGGSAHYWMVTTSGNSNSYATNFHSTGQTDGAYSRAYGFPVRCIAE